MQPTVEKLGDVAVIGVNYEHLDASNADDFRRDAEPILKSSPKAVLDLNRVKFIDSRGCGMILSCLKLVTALGGDLKICNVHKAVRTVFDLIRLHKICQIFNTKEEAVKAFTPST